MMPLVSTAALLLSLLHPSVPSVTGQTYPVVIVEQELAIARSLAYINAFVSALISASPILVAVAAFTLYRCPIGSLL